MHLPLQLLVLFAVPTRASGVLVASPGWPVAVSPPGWDAESRTLAPRTEVVACDETAIEPIDPYFRKDMRVPMVDLSSAAAQSELVFESPAQGSAISMTDCVAVRLAPVHVHAPLSATSATLVFLVNMRFLAKFHVSVAVTGNGSTVVMPGFVLAAHFKALDPFNPYARMDYHFARFVRNNTRYGAHLDFWNLHAYLMTDGWILGFGSTRFKVIDPHDPEREEWPSIIPVPVPLLQERKRITIVSSTHKSSYSRLAHACNLNKQLYARHHGYDVVISDTDVYKASGEIEDRSGYYSKVIALRKALEGASPKTEWVMWMDEDSWFNHENWETRLEGFLVDVSDDTLLVMQVCQVLAASSAAPQRCATQ